MVGGFVFFSLVSEASVFVSKAKRLFANKKIEESVETIIAAKDYAAQNTESNLNDLIYETADLWFHSIVMLGYFDLNPQLIIDELARRQGLSGLVEKANRNKV